MLKIKNLSKSFSKKTVLKDINLDIQAGKLTTLLGENGSGKSTLLNILSGYELPDQGEVTYKDVDLAKFNFPYQHDIFYVHEKLDYQLSIPMSEYIDILKEKIPNWDEILFQKMVKDRKIDLHNDFQSFSRGQKMQIALMIGLASRPKVLLLDEITSVIDTYGRKYFLDLLRKYVDGGGTVVITTNIISELDFYTDHLIVIKEHGIVLNKDVDEIPDLFIKVRSQEGAEHELFNHPQCVWSGMNSDKSISYIIPKELAQEIDIPGDLFDRRGSTLEDVFIYYFSQDQKEEVSDENAA